jgi:hypothetical protein
MELFTYNNAHVIRPFRFITENIVIVDMAADVHYYSRQVRLIL